MSSLLHSGPRLPTERTYSAFLFDMDGTLIDSLGSSLRCWKHWAARHGVDFDPMWREIHGMRQADAMRRWGPAGINIASEVEALIAAEMADCEDVVSIPGAGRLLHELPEDRWCVVTSAPRRLALRRLEVAGLPTPENIIAAEDVENGKPAPDCFLRAAKKLGFMSDDCLAWEDAPAGIAAAESAGMDVVVVSAMHVAQMKTDHMVIRSYDELSLALRRDGELQLAVTAG